METDEEIRELRAQLTRYQYACQRLIRDYDTIGLHPTDSASVDDLRELTGFGGFPDHLARRRVVLRDRASANPGAIF